jgi:hypothetical protein
MYQLSGTPIAGAADMRIRTPAFLAALACSLGLLGSGTAHAQAPGTTVVVQQPQPVYPQGYAPAYPPGYAPPPGYGPGPGYTTPIYQQVQPSYIPQSVAFSGPRVITDWSEGEPIPPGYHETTRIRKGLVIGGAVLFGTTYLFTALGASVVEGCGNSCGNSNVGSLFVPGVGPFIQMAQPGNGALGNFWLAVDGIAQLGGITMFVVGLAAPKTVLIRNDLGSSSKKDFQLALSPIVGPGRQGMGLVGAF